MLPPAHSPGIFGSAPEVPGFDAVNLLDGGRKKGRLEEKG